MRSAQELRKRYMAGKKFSTVVIAEGAQHMNITDKAVPECNRDELGARNSCDVGNLLGEELEHRICVETRVTVPGHVQREAPSTAFDRILATGSG
jgi:6-phosphofructokinase 1